MKKYWFLIIGAAALLFLSLHNKEASAPEPITVSAFKLNTVIEITIYDSDNRQLLENALALCDKYEQIFSRTKKDSELYRLNHGLIADNHVSDELYALAKEALAYCAVSDGALDISVAPVSSLWDFSAADPQVPAESSVSKALPLVDYHAVTCEKNRILFAKGGMQLDLGAVAKGYIADRIKDYLVSEEVKSAIINLGGNVLCIGSKPDKAPFTIGIQKPFADRSETADTLQITGRSVVSSGTYERFFEKNGTLYHHILDPDTGYPCRNNLLSVTIISDSSLQGDALSTACFVLGLEKGSELIQNTPGVEAIFITNDDQLHYVE